MPRNPTLTLSKLAPATPAVLSRPSTKPSARHVVITAGHRAPYGVRGGVNKSKLIANATCKITRRIRERVVWAGFPDLLNRVFRWRETAV